MSDQLIHPTAIIEPGAKIGKNVTIEPYAIIKKDVTLEDGVVIKSHAYIDGHTTIGEGATIWPFASIGTKTQDLKFRGERTFIRIGKRCEIREYVTINGSCGEDSEVKVGDDVLIMAYCHIGHNCVVGNHVIMSNGSALAGHVEVEDWAIIGGHTPIHQFCRIGGHAMVGGFSKVTRDVAPYTIGTGVDPYRPGGLNMVGLKRRGFGLETRRALSQSFKIVFRSGLHLSEALEKVEREVEQIPEVLHFINFCKESKRGIAGTEGVAKEPLSNDFEGAEELELASS